MADTTFTTTFSDPALVVTTVFGVGVPGPTGPAGSGGTWSSLTGEVNHLPFDITPTDVPTTEGTLSWNPTDHTLNLQTEIAAVVQQVGQELLVPIHNNTGGTLTDGTCVAITGSTGERMTVAKAIASNATHAISTIGLVTADIANGDNGYVNVFGRVRDVATNGYSGAEGSPLYVSPDTAGTLTSTKPTSPNWVIRAGWIEKKAGAGAGRIMVSCSRLSVDNAEVIGLGSAATKTTSEVPNAGYIPVWTSDLAIGGTVYHKTFSANDIYGDGRVALVTSALSSVHVIPLFIFGFANKIYAGTGAYYAQVVNLSVLQVSIVDASEQVICTLPASSVTAIQCNGYSYSCFPINSSTTFSSERLIKWDATAAATRSNLGITATGDTLATAANRLAAQEAMGRRIAYKTSDETRTATTTLADDSTMVLALAAGSVYEITTWVEMTAAATPGLKFRINFSSALDGINGNNYGEISANGGAFTSYTIPAGGSGDTLTRAGASTRYVYKIRATIKTLLACNVSIQWAQNTSDAGATTMLAGSYLTAFKLYPA